MATKEFHTAPTSRDLLDDSLLKAPRTDAGDRYINRLRGDIRSGVGSQFHRTLLAELDEHPDMTIKDCWELVEAHFATEGGVSPRRYPFRFIN